nr:ATP-binding cassette domain-containing protein [Burkholderiales bacterium]
VEGLCGANKVQDVSFQVRAGEVVGITGLVGAGRTEVAQLVTGVRSPDAGMVNVDGAAVNFKTATRFSEECVC